jgi:hypothetical protein
VLFIAIGILLAAVKPPGAVNALAPLMKDVSPHNAVLFLVVFNSYNQVFGVADPTSTRTVWAAQYAGVTPQQVMARTLPHMVYEAGERSQSPSPSPAAGNPRETPREIPTGASGRAAGRPLRHMAVARVPTRVPPAYRPVVVEGATSEFPQSPSLDTATGGIARQKAECPSPDSCLSTGIVALPSSEQSC